MNAASAGTAQRASGRGARWAHGAWALLAAVVCLLMVATGSGGHPPVIVFLPVVLLVWLIGHVALAVSLRLAAIGRRAVDAGAGAAEPWPIGLRLALLGTAVMTSLGAFQLLMTAYLGRLYPYREPGLWTVALVIGMAHALCLAGLLMRRKWSRAVGAVLAFGWASLLAWQTAEHLLRGAPIDPVGMLVAIGLLTAAASLGAYLAISRRVIGFLAR